MASPKDNAELNRFPQLTGTVNAIDFSADGKQILAGCDDGKLRLLDTASGAEITAYGGHRGPVTAVAFTPDGKAASHCADDHRLRIFRLPDGPKDASSGGKKTLFGQ